MRDVALQSLSKLLVRGYKIEIEITFRKLFLVSNSSYLNFFSGI
jgi:hypothetical protein